MLEDVLLGDIKKPQIDSAKSEVETHFEDIT